MTTVKHLKTWLNNHWREFMVAVLALVFFLGTSSYNYFLQTPDFVKWNSPDETANYLLAKKFAQTGQLTLVEKYNDLAGGLLVPRSLMADGSQLKPVSFLGLMIYYGTVAKIFGLGLLPFLTPLIGAMGLIFFYLLIKKLFNQDNALIATTLLAFFPVYVYYSARSLFHNVPFVVFLIISFYFTLLSGEPALKSVNRQHSNWLYALYGGLFMGLAIAFRTSELIWLGPLLILLWLANLKHWSKWSALLFVGASILTYLPVLIFNQALYGSLVASGYSLTGDVATTNNLSLGQKFYQAVTFFGFHPRQSSLMFSHYFIEMFPALWYGGVAGLIIFCFKFWQRKKSDALYLIALVGVGAILVLYYGSWKFFDNPDPLSFTIGNSYTRYWLPLYLMSLPLVSLAIIRLTRLLKFKSAIILTRLALVLILTGGSLSFVLFGSEEGLVPTFYRQQASRAEFNKVISLTEPGSVIITRYYDKLLFPERRVIIGSFHEASTNEAYARLAEVLPLYYYNLRLSDQELKRLNETKLLSWGLELKLKQRVTAEASLYSLQKKNKPLE